ncbi:MAG: radical SAM protein [bacterium]|nr:radical SAM protein [bacterium]
MNLIITDVCNRNCAYCFAKSKLNLETETVPVQQKDRYISMENFLVYLDFLEKSNDKKLKLLGGEPTLHPLFTQLLDTALERGPEITIFTNGMWNDEVCGYFKKNLSPRVNFVVNINEPRFRTTKEEKMQARSLSIAGERARCGFNIYRKDFDLVFLGEMVEKFSLKRLVRLGLACPIVSKRNEFVGDADLKAVGTRLAGQLRELEKRDILGAFDCGFPFCMFSEEELGTLTIASTGFVSICSYIIDVGPDLTAWPCFPLSTMFNVKLTDFDNADHLKSYYEEKLGSFRQFGSREECMGCKYMKRGQCVGGCMARGIAQWAESDPTFFKKMGINK